MTKNKTTTTFLLFLLPTIALANAGSPMMWFGIFHLVVINAFIGWAESAIIKRYTIPNQTWLIIIGNYVSMFLGLYYIAPYFSSVSGNQDFWGGQTNYGYYQMQGFAVGMITSYLAIIIIELPFYYFSVKHKHQRGLILIPFLVANSMTYIVMTIIYFLIVIGGGQW